MHAGDTHTHAFHNVFPPPRFLAMPRVGLDISDQRIRLLELERNGSSIRVKRFAETTIEEGVLEQGHVKKEDAFVQVLTDFKRRHEIQFVSALFPEERAYLVRMEIPNVSDTDMRESIAYELDQYVPLPPTEAVFDYEIIGTSHTKKEFIDVGVSVLPRKEVNEYLSFFERAGIIPFSLEIEAQAVMRSVIPYGNDDTHMIVDIGRDRTGISVTTEGVLHFTSTTEVGSAMVTRALQKAYNISFEDAEAMKNTKMLGKSGADADFSATILPTISTLRDEINKLYIYWHTHRQGQHSDKKIKTILLCGGGANLPGLSEYLSASLRVHVEVANPWVNVAPLDEYIPPIPFNAALGACPVIGLALKAIHHD